MRRPGEGARFGETGNAGPASSNREAGAGPSIVFTSGSVHRSAKRLLLLVQFEAFLHLEVTPNPKRLRYAAQCWQHLKRWEKHVVEFNFNQLLGNLVIRVDSEPVLQSTRVFNEPVNEVFKFVVGKKEKAEVRIEKRRKPLFGHHNRVFVDNRLARVVDGF